MHLSSVHPVDDVRVYHRECVALAQRGFAVTLVGREAAIDGGPEVGVDRLVLFPYPTRLGRMIGGGCEVLWRAITKRADIYHVHDPELIPVGIVLKILGRRVVFDSHEDLRKQVASKHWIPRVLQPVARGFGILLQKVAGRVFDGVVAATPSIGQSFRRAVPNAVVTVVQNFPRLEEFANGSSKPYRERPLHIGYVGRLNYVRGASEMLDALEIVNHRRTDPCILEIAGRFATQELQFSIESHSGWQHVRFQDWVAREEIWELYGRLRAGLVLFQALPNHVEAQPSKLFEYMAAGLPVVASDFPHWKTIVEDTGAGITVDPRSPLAIAEAIERIIADPKGAEEMGRRGRHVVREQFNWHREVPKLVKAYEGLLGTLT